MDRRTTTKRGICVWIDEDVGRVNFGGEKDGELWWRNENLESLFGEGMVLPYRVLGGIVGGT